MKTFSYTTKEWKALPTAKALEWFNNPNVVIRQTAGEFHVTFN